MLIMILSDKSIAVIFCFDFLLKYTERCVYKILLFEKISLQFSGYADFRGGGGPTLLKIIKFKECPPVIYLL